MTKSKTEFRRLQTLYVSDFDAMGKDDLKAFLALLQADSDAPFRESRMRNIRRRLDGVERAEQAREQREEAWMKAAREDKAIKERWEAKGARWRSVGTSLVKWEYDGVEFYRWWSGVKVTEEIVNVRKADERLAKMMAEKAAERTTREGVAKV